MKNFFSKGISFGLGFVFVIILTGITFATYNQLSDVVGGNTLTSTIWNKMIDNQDDFNTRLGTLETNSTYGAVFSVSASSSVSTAANTRKIVPLDMKQIDTNNYFNTSTFRFQPTKAGYYRINLNLSFGMTGIGGFTIVGAIFKNGIVYRESHSLVNYTASFTDTVSVSDVIYFNGSTDYIDARFMSNFGTPSNGNTYMSGEFIRP